jgi:hypothetical protein
VTLFCVAAVIFSSPPHRPNARMEIQRGMKTRRSAGASSTARGDRMSTSKFLSRFRRSKPDDRQQLTQNEAEPGTCSSTDLTVDSPRCEPNVNLTSIPFAPNRAEHPHVGSVNDESRTETGSAPPTCEVSRNTAVATPATTAHKHDRPTNSDRNMAPHAEREHRRDGDEVAAARIPSSSLAEFDGELTDVLDGVADHETVKFRVLDDDDDDDESPVSEQYHNSESTTSLGGTRNKRRCSQDLEADGPQVRSSTRRRNRKQRVKRFARRVNVCCRIAVLVFCSNRVVPGPLCYGACMMGSDTKSTRLVIQL